MTPDRLGYVPLVIGDRTVELRFSWAAIDALGRNGVSAVFTRAQSGEPGDVRALADLIVVAASGAVSLDEIMADPPSIADGLSAVLQAWLIALHGPTGKPREDREEADPPKPRRTWLRALLAPRSPPG